MSVEYPLEFWQRAFKLANTNPHQCAKCKALASNEPRERVIVRVVLTEPGKPMPHKLALMCTKCFPDAREVKPPRKAILQKIMELPFPEPDKAKTINGR